MFSPNGEHAQMCPENVHCSLRKNEMPCRRMLKLVGKLFFPPAESFTISSAINAYNEPRQNDFVLHHAGRLPGGAGSVSQHQLDCSQLA